MLVLFLLTLAGYGLAATRKPTLASSTLLAANGVLIAALALAEPIPDTLAELHIDGENRHRAGIADADEVRAHQQLLELGLTAGQIAQRSPAQLAHVAQRMRDECADEQLQAAWVIELVEAGVSVVDADADAIPLTGLRPGPTDPDGTELTETAHAGCPGHAAQVRVRRGWGDDEPTVVTICVCIDPTGNGHAPRVRMRSSHARRRQERLR